MAVKTRVENRLLSPHNTLTKAFTTNVSFLRGFTMRSVKTDPIYSETAHQKVKTLMANLFMLGLAIGMLICGSGR